jgi:hypothetical protein
MADGFQSAKSAAIGLGVTMGALAGAKVVVGALIPSYMAATAVVVKGTGSIMAKGILLPHFCLLCSLDSSLLWGGCHNICHNVAYLIITPVVTYHNTS